MYPSGCPTCKPAPDGYGNMSRTYFFGRVVSRSGVLKVSCSSQYACHFGSTSAKGYDEGAAAAVDSIDEDAAVVEKRRQPKGLRMEVALLLLLSVTLVPWKRNVGVTKAWVVARRKGCCQERNTNMVVAVQRTIRRGGELKPTKKFIHMLSFLCEPFGNNESLSFGRDCVFQECLSERFEPETGRRAEARLVASTVNYCVASKRRVDER